MREFIEKLIGRLEEERKKYTSEYGLIDIQVQEVFVNVRKIVKELAEECNNDFCEWKMFKANARLRHKNCMFSEDTVDPWKFNFCPYCGKKIKVVE